MCQNVYAGTMTKTWATKCQHEACDPLVVLACNVSASAWILVSIATRAFFCYCNQGEKGPTVDEVFPTTESFPAFSRNEFVPVYQRNVVSSAEYYPFPPSAAIYRRLDHPRRHETATSGSGHWNPIGLSQDSNTELATTNEHSMTRPSWHVSAAREGIADTPAGVESSRYNELDFESQNKHATLQRQESVDGETNHARVTTNLDAPTVVAAKTPILNSSTVEEAPQELAPSGGVSEDSTAAGADTMVAAGAAVNTPFTSSDSSVDANEASCWSPCVSPTKGTENPETVPRNEKKRELEPDTSHDYELAMALEAPLLKRSKPVDEPDHNRKRRGGAKTTGLYDESEEAPVIEILDDIDSPPEQDIFRGEHRPLFGHHFHRNPRKGWGSDKRKKRIHREDELDAALMSFASSSMFGRKRPKEVGDSLFSNSPSKKSHVKLGSEMKQDMVALRKVSEIFHREL
jgi:hypothetical protein